jgi:hypothetical protein
LLGVDLEGDPLLVVVGSTTGPDLQLSLAGLVTASQVNALVIAANPFDRTVTVDLEFLVLASRVALPDLELGAVYCEIRRQEIRELV